MNKNLSKFGTILKRETLASANLSIDSPALVLNSNDPYPGFYCKEAQPADNSCKEIAYYLPIRETNIREEDLCRISLEIQSKLHINICPAWFNLEESQIHAFRVKELEETELPNVIRIIERDVISLYKYKKVKNFLSYIHLKSFFEIHQIDKDIYKNAESDGLYYFLIPDKISWEQFEQIITYQKSKSKIKNFDAATGFWIEKPAFRDFIRIYTKDLDIEQLNIIRKEFIINYNKYIKQGMLI